MTYDPRREDLLHQSAKSATTTDKDWRRAYAESDGDHRSYVERYAEPASPDPRGALIAELCEALEAAQRSLEAYRRCGNAGSKISREANELRRAAELKLLDVSRRARGQG